MGGFDLVTVVSSPANYRTDRYFLGPTGLKQILWMRPATIPARWFGGGGGDKK